MIVTEVTARLAMKIPGPVQYSSIEVEASMSGSLEEHEDPTAVLSQLYQLIRDSQFPELISSRRQQYAIVTSDSRRDDSARRT